MSEELRPYGTDSTDPPAEPLTREEQYLSAIAGVTSSSDIPPKPLTRVEKYLNKIVENGGGGGGGGTTNYNELSNRPQVNNKTLEGNMSLSDLGAQAALDTNQMAAVNSGVTSTDVEQIATNKTNISTLQTSLAVGSTDNAKVLTAIYEDGEGSYAWITPSGGGGGTTDYTLLENKPQINSVTLTGNKSLSDLGIAAAADIPTVPITEIQRNSSTISPVSGVVNISVPTQASDINAATATQGSKADSAIQGITVNSTTVTPDSNKIVNITVPTTAADVSAIPTTEKGANGGVAALDSSGKLTAAQLPLGTTSTTAYRGDRGNTAYTHATDSSRLTTATASGLYKVASTNQGHIASLTSVVKSDITALGIPAQDTTYSYATTTTAGLMSATDKSDITIENITSSFATAASGYTVSNISNVYKRGKHIFGTLIIKKDSGTIDTAETVIGTIASAYRTAVAYTSVCGFGTTEWNIKSAGSVYLSASAGTITATDYATTNSVCNININYCIS